MFYFVGTEVRIYAIDFFEKSVTACNRFFFEKSVTGVEVVSSTFLLLREDKERRGVL